MGRFQLEFIKDIFLGVIVGGVTAFFLGVFLNYLIFIASSHLLFVLYPEHLFLQKLIRPLIEKHAFFLSTLDYYCNHYISSLGTAQLDLKLGFWKWEMSLGSAIFQTVLYFPFLSTLLTPAIAITLGGWIAGKINRDRSLKLHPWIGLLTAIPYTGLLWWGKGYVTAESEKFSATFAFIFHLLSNFKIFPLDWQIWLWGIIFSGVFGFIGGSFSARTFVFPIASSARSILKYAARAFFFSGVGVVLFGLGIAFINAWSENGNWILFVLFLGVAIVVLLLNKKWLTWGILSIITLTFLGVMLSYLYLAHGVKFEGRLAVKKPFHQHETEAPGKNKLELGLIEGHPAFYSVKELFTLKGFFALSEVAKVLREGLIKQEPFPWYWKLLPLIPFGVLGWHGYLFSRNITPCRFYSGAVALMASWYTAFLLLFLPFAENRFHFFAQIWKIDTTITFVFAPVWGQVLVQGFLFAIISIGLGCWLGATVKRRYQ